jgi:hypothetical protein
VANALAVIGLTYGGTDIQNSSIGTFLEIRRGLNEIPEVRGIDTIIPSAVGRRLRNRVKDRRIIELFGYVAGTGSGEAAQRSSFRTQVAALKALFDPTVSRSLVATLENGGTGTIAARTLTMIWGDAWSEDLSPSFASVSIELESVAPEWTIT